MILTRRELRHLLTRARNDRVARLGPDEPGVPTMLFLSPVSLSDVLMDDDPDERWAIDFEGKAFMGVPITTQAHLSRGTVEIQWTS